MFYRLKFYPLCDLQTANLEFAYKVMVLCWISGNTWLEIYLYVSIQNAGNACRVHSSLAFYQQVNSSHRAVRILNWRWGWFSVYIIAGLVVQLRLFVATSCNMSTMNRERFCRRHVYTVYNSCISMSLVNERILSK